MSNPPLWVFLVLAALVVLGLRQTQPGTMSRGRLLLVPLVMAALSFSALSRLFGLSVLPVLAWAVGVLVPVVLRRPLLRQPGAAFSASRQVFEVQGSWLPLLLMLSIFALRFVATAGVHVDPDLATSTAFATVMAAAFGLPSGVFVARALLILGTAYGPRKVLVA